MFGTCVWKPSSNQLAVSWPQQIAKLKTPTTVEVAATRAHLDKFEAFATKAACQTAMIPNSSVPQKTTMLLSRKLLGVEVVP